MALFLIGAEVEANKDVIIMRKNEVIALLILLRSGGGMAMRLDAFVLSLLLVTSASSCGEKEFEKRRTDKFWTPLKNKTIRLEAYFFLWEISRPSRQRNKR